MRVRVLGPMEVEVGGEMAKLGGPKQRALLALLVMRAPRHTPVDELILELWGDDASAGARSTLQTYVSSLRQVLGEAVAYERGGYRLDVDPEAVDAVRFERALERARGLVATDPRRVAEDLREALGWWRGRPYADLLDFERLESETRRLETLRLEAVEMRIEADLALGRHAELVAELEALAEQHPTREHFRAQHMLALYRCGRQADALRAFRTTEEYLRSELGIDPSAELRELEYKVLDHHPDLDAGVTTAVTRTLAILVTDIEGSTGKWDRHPQAMATALADHDRIVTDEVQRAGGRVFKHTGDGILAAFPDAISAVTGAEAIQRTIGATDWGDIEELRIRMGIDVGEVDHRSDDMYGPPVNRAARLSAAAHGGQVLVSSAVQREVMSAASPGVQIRQLGEVHLRGMAEPERVAQMVYVGLPADFPELRLDASASLDDRVEVITLPGYEVRERIGQGSTGVVWRAYQPSVGREVAIKVIREEFAAEPSFVRRFEAEARTIARLAHPHIVPLIDFWRDANRAYLVLAMLPGGSLANALRTDRPQAAVARRILGQIGNALDHAHSQGIVHADLKPANVLLDGAGNAYLSDFGIAGRLVDVGVVSSASTSPQYLPPEYSSDGLAPSADRYAFAVLAGELLGADGDMSRVIARGTASDPADRYPSCAAMLDEIDSALPGLVTEPTRNAVTRNPYKGLRAFDEADAADFYGRDDLVAALVSAVAGHRFVAVIGPSGSGKSSVVRSGLLPALRKGAVDGSEEWLPLVFTPGEAPLASLARAARTVTGQPCSELDLASQGTAALRSCLGPDTEAVLVIDQFEEVYTLVDDEDRRQQFLDVVTDWSESQRGHVVVTLRADFYDRPLQDEEMGRLVRDGQVTVLPPTRDELIAMITGPAQAVGLRWEPGLPHRIATDVSDQPGGLPLLQYALTEIVEQRAGDLLTASDYQRIGEVTGALALRAEGLYSSLGIETREAARSILLRLVTVDEHTGHTRRRVRRTELESVGIPLHDLETVLDLFVTERLLLADRDPTTREPTIEVAHEALLREWPRLAGWVEDEKERLLLGRRFRAALGEWENNGRDEDYLLTGGRLLPFADWAGSVSLTPEERAYFEASSELDQRQRTVRRRRRRTLVATLGSAAVVASLLGVVALAQADRAEVEASRARASELSAFAVAAVPTDPMLAKLLVAASASVAEPSLGTIGVMHRAIAADPVVDRYHWPEDRDVGFFWASLSPDATKLVAAGCSCDTPSNYLEVYDLQRREVLWSFDGIDSDQVIVDSPIFTPDGRQVAVGLFWLGDDEPAGGPLGALIFDAETGEQVAYHDLGRCGGTVYGASDTHLLTDRVDAEEGCFHGNMDLPPIQLVDRATGEARTLSSAARGGVMSRDGGWVAYTNASGPAEVLVVEDAQSGLRVMEVEVSGPPRHARGLNHDGSLVIFSMGNDLEVWDVREGELANTVPNDVYVWSVEFSATGDDTVFSTGRTGAMKHWDARTGTVIAEYPAVGNGNVSTTAGGTVVVADQTARIANILSSAPVSEIWGARIPTCEGQLMSGGVVGAGSRLTVYEYCVDAAGARTWLVDMSTRSMVEVPGGQWQSLAVSPDGSRFVRGEAGAPTADPQELGAEPFHEWFGPLSIRDMRTGEQLVELEGLCTWTRRAAVPRHEQPGCNAFPEQPFPHHATVALWSTGGGAVAVWDFVDSRFVMWSAEDGRLLSSYDECDDVRGAYMTADELIVYCVVDAETAVFSHVRIDDGQVRTSVTIPRLGTAALEPFGYTTDGSSLVLMVGIGGPGGADVVWFDPETYEEQYRLDRVHEGSPTSFARRGSFVATAAADGSVKVWDIDRRELLHEIETGVPVNGVAFTDDSHLAVVSQDGTLRVYTLDVEELLGILVHSLVRDFTPEECARFGFTDHCPTREDLAARP